MAEKAGVTIAEFNLQFNTAKTVVRAGDSTVAAEQERLRGLLPLMDRDAQDWATELIDDLPAITAPTPPPTPEMVEALAIRDAAATIDRGTREERIAAIDLARNKIWDLADKAPKAEAARIRGLTRMLDHLQEAVENPVWESPPPTDPRG